MTSLMIAAALKGTIVLGAAWIATSLLRRSSADLRHRIWLAAFIAMHQIDLLYSSVRSPAHIKSKS